MTRRLLSALCAVACLGVVLLGFAAPSDATPASVAQTTRNDVLGLISQSPVVEPDADFVVRLRVTGAPAGATIRADVHGRVPTRTDFDASLSDKNLRPPVGSPTIVPATPDPSGAVVVSIATRDVQSTVPADPSVATIRIGEGVYPVTIALIEGHTTIQQLLTYMVRLPVTHEFGPLDVAVVLPIGGPPAVQPDGTVRLDQATADSALSTASVLSAHADVPLTVEATAETIDALDPATVDALHGAVSGRQLSTTSYVQLHPSEWVASGLDDQLSRQFDRGTATLTAALAPPTPSTYIADDRLTPQAARYLQQRGVTSMVVPDDALTGLDPKVFNRTLTQPFALRDSNGIEAVAGDTDLAAHMGSTGDPVLDANHLLADLAVLYFDDPPDQREATFVLPDDKPIDSNFLNALLTGLAPATNRILNPVTLSTLFSTVPTVGANGQTSGRGAALTRGLQPKASDDLSSFGRKLTSTEGDLSSFSTMVAANNPLPDSYARRILVAGANGLSNDQRSSYLNGVTGAIRGELQKVQPPPRQTINFTARDGVVSLTVKLSTGYPVTVDLFLQGDKLEFPGHEDGHIAVTLTEESTRVPINVRTRASGDSPLDITLQTPDGGMVIAKTRVTVRSTAFSGVGIVLLVGAGGFLALWWGRHILTARRATRRQPRHAAA